MKKHYLYLATFLITSLFMLPINLFGQTTAQINQTYNYGNGSGSSPFFGYWTDHKVQSIYSASELTNAGLAANAVISSIHYYIYATNSSQIYSNFNLGALQTTVSSIANPVKWFGTSNIYSGTASTKGLAGTWYEFVLSTPITWDGTSNIVFESCFDNSSWTNSDDVAYSYDKSNYLSQYAYNYTNSEPGCSPKKVYSYSGYRPVIQLTFANPSSNPTDYYVATTGSNSNDGSSGSPWLTLTHAISQASDGDNINIGAGTYSSDLDIDLTKELTIIGAGIEGASKTIFDGGNSGDAFMFIDANNVTLKKFVVQNYEETTKGGDNYGGAACEIDASQKGIVFEDMVFNANIASKYNSTDGGAIYIQKGPNSTDAMVTFTRCIFSGNRCGKSVSSVSSYGGAVYQFNNTKKAYIYFYSCLFYENTAGGYGSAVTIRNNTSTTSKWTRLYMKNCTFADNVSNYSTSYAGAIYTYRTYAYVYNSAFANNISASTANPYQAYGYSGYEYMYNCRSTASSIDNGFVNYSSWGNVTAAFTDAANDDYTLTSSSYFVNAGGNNYYPSGGDLGEGARQSTADVGCYEYCGSATWDGSESADMTVPANYNTDHAGCLDLTFSGTGTGPAITGTITIPGDLAVSSGGSFTLESGGTLNLKGDLTNAGTFTDNGGTINFTGEAEQTLNAGGSTLANVVVNNGGNGVKLTTGTVISNTLTLTDGGINTNGNMLELTNEDPSAFTGWSNANFITATSANGALRQHIDNDGSSSATYTFPVGLGSGSTNYARLDVVNNNLTNTSGSSFNYLDVYVEDDNESGNNHSQFLNVRKNGTKGVYASTRTFYMVPDNQPNSGTYGLNMNLENLTFGWGKGEVTNSAEDGKMFIVKADHTNTDGLSAYSSFDGTTTAGGSYADNQITQTGFTSFSKSKGVLANDPLPIDLLDFNAEVSEEDLIDLTWTTASEINNDFFTIERSRDAVDFDILATVPGAGNSNEMLYYEAEDSDPMLGVSYYRLKQTDYDGKHSYSKIVSVKNLKQLNFAVMPNPTTEKLTVTFGKVEGNTVFVMTPEYKADIKIFNTIGKLVYKKKFDGTFYKFTIDVTKLPEGMYYVNLKANNELYKTSFLKQ